MKQSWTIMLALSASSAAATDAPIQSVTLYPGSATVERVVQVAPGANQVEITGLLANFNKETVRLQADPGIQVGQVVTRDQRHGDSPSPRAAELEGKIQALQDQVASIDADAKSAQLVQSYLERLGAGGNGANPAPIDPKALAGTLEVIRKGGAEALERMQADEVRKRGLGKQLEVLKQDLAKAQASTRDSRVMTVFLSARQAGKIVLSYQVDRAGWKPAYRASLDSQASTVELERMATISQKTGEDWSNVRLRLSTGQPNLSVYPPNPMPWLLDYRDPMPEGRPSIMSFRAPAAPAPVAADARRFVTANATSDDYVAPVFQTEGNFSTEFEVPARVNLASDGREISVGLARQSLQARQRVLIAPRTSSDAAVLTAESSRPEGVWPAGQVQLQRDGSYVGSIYWDPQASDRFQLAFGRDTLVHVVVEHRKDKSGDAGILGHDKEKRIDDSYAVTSFHRQPIDVLVLEPTPVSQSDKVSVKVALHPEPAVKEWEHRRGLVAWEATLKPNETAHFDAGYVIVYPAEGLVQGLR